MLFHSSVGTVALTAADSVEAETERIQKSKSRIAEVTFNGRPSKIELGIEVAVGKEESKVFLVKNGQAREMLPGTFNDFVVPVKWDKDNVPLTRQKGVDNVDIIVMERNGRFMDFQCSVITRKERFFLSNERTYTGYLVRTRGDNNAVKMEFLPACSRLAYPGFSYEATWGNMATAIIGEAKIGGLSQRKSVVKGAAATWRPPEISKGVDAGGYRQAVVLYFNMVTGTGVIEDAERVRYFVHFHNIIDGGPVPVLTPCTAVAFKPGAKKIGERYLSVNAVKEIPPVAVAAANKQ